jgi:hypothetical protein
VEKIKNMNDTYLERSNVSVNNASIWLKRGIWAYFLLVIFEGALRKWVLPGLATPLLVVRDPIAIWLILLAWNRGFLPSNFYLGAITLIAIIGVFTTTLLGHGNVLVALFGARILLLHFPLIFVIGRVFDRHDVVLVGRATLWLALPMVVIITMQFYSPQSAWINRGIGGDMEGAGFSGAMGYLRPPGTFSFTSGNTDFFSFVAPFVFYFWFDKKHIHNLLLIASTMALLFSIPLSISRTLLFQVIISLSFSLVASIRKPENLGRMVIAVVGGIIVLALLSQSDFFLKATEAFTDRFESANENEGGLESVFLDRFLGGLIGALTIAPGIPFFGYGLGMGTNVGSKLLTGDITFLISEGEWGRVIGELGALMGLAVVFIRLGLTAKIALACYKKLSQGDLLPWMLLSLGLLRMAQAGWAQPTSLGFFVLIGGLMIASLRMPSKEISNKTVPFARMI